MDVDLGIFCEREVTWVDAAVSCSMCAKCQHRLCYTGITEDIYTAANRDQAEFVCGLCQHELQPRHGTELIIEELPGQFPDIDIPDEAVSRNFNIRLIAIYIFKNRLVSNLI